MKYLLMIHMFLLSLLAQDIYLISNKGLKANSSEIKKLFFKKTEYLSGEKYKIISNEEAIELFSRKAFGISAKKLSKKWIKQNFRKGMPFPKEFKDDKATIEWIKTNDNTLGFVKNKPNGVHIIYTFSE